MSDIADSLGNVYHRLGMLLNVGRAFIEQVEYDYKKLTRVTFEILVRWRDNARESGVDTMAMAEELCRALEALNQNDVADKVRHGE